jgi:phosphopantetheine adenylyltransferase
LTQLTPEAIGQATGGYLRGALHAELTPALTSMQGELSSIRELQGKHGQAVDYLVTRLREELIEPVVARLDETAQLTKEASEAVKELKTALGDITISLAGAVETIQKFQKETLRDLKQFAFDLKGILDQFSRDTNGVLVTVADEIKRAVAESIRGMEAQREAFARSAALAANSFRGIRVELEKSLDKQAELQKEMLQGVEASTRKVLEDANQAFISQSQTLITLGQEASALMNEAAANLTATLVNIDEMLQKTRITVQEELEKFRVAYQESLTKFFEDQNNLLEETLGRQRAALEIVIAQLQKVFLEDAKEMGKEIKEAMESIQKTANTVYNLANKTGLTSGERLEQLHEITRELGSEAKQIESAYQNMVEKFDNSLNKSLTLMVDRLNEALQIGNKQLTEYLQKANESYTNAIKDGDIAAAKVCQELHQTAHNLNQTSHGLMDVSHYLVASANELKNGNGSRN